MIIPQIVLPTDEEMIEVSNNWYQIFDGLKFTDWNDELIKNSYPFKVIECDKALIKDFLKDSYKDARPAILALSETINFNTTEFGDGFFIKLISRSPKDYLADKDNHNKPLSLWSGHEAAMALRQSMRTFEDLCLIEYLDKFEIILRPYINFHPKNEWRCFIKDKKIVGISQYYYDSTFTDLQPNGIREFIVEIVIPNVSKSNFVADVVNEDGCVLLELNPFGKSDPCLFGSYENLDGSTKYNK